MEPVVTHPPRVIRWALALGIAIVLNVLFFSIASLALPAPQYDQYCPVNTGPVPQSQAACDATGGTWTANPVGPAPASLKVTPESTGYCDLYSKCQRPYQDAVSQHALYAFVLMVVLGIGALATGLMPLGSSAIASGLSCGGALALVIGSISYWSNAGGWIRLTIAATGLVALLYIGWQRFQDE